jgi:hypothetical protein
LIIIDGSKQYYKGNLHAHTTVSDGRQSPAESVETYRALGYDFLAVTDHWQLNSEGYAGEMLVMRGCEYDFDIANQALHIVGVFPADADPRIIREDAPNRAVSRINRAGGAAILAHPAWSMNTLDVMLSLEEVCGAEVFNAISGMPWGADRAYSGTQLDIAANHGRLYGFLAGDDAHYYDGECGMGWNMVGADTLSAPDIIGALKRGDYYATQGPLIRHAEYDPEVGLYRVECTPASRIVFYSNLPWSRGRCLTGEGLTSGEYSIKREYGERYIRCEVIDEAGRRAWISPIWV